MAYSDNIYSDSFHGEQRSTFPGDLSCIKFYGVAKMRLYLDFQVK